jgi:hypothetical protein
LGLVLWFGLAASRRRPLGRSRRRSGGKHSGGRCRYGHGGGRRV